jgi:exonuclease III
LNTLCSVWSVFVAGAASALVKFYCVCRDRFSDIPRISFASTTVALILLTSFGHVETNPGPTSTSTNKLTFGVWNLDSLLARDGIKKTFIEGIDSFHQFDIFGICESYLTDKVSDKDLEINGFSAVPFRADCADVANSAHGGVCLYFKEHLPIKERKDLTSLSETIVAEVALKSKKVFFVLSYRSPSHSSKPEILDYISRLNNTMANIKKEKPSLVVFTGDFNARSQLFWAEEHTYNDAGRSLSEFMLLNGLEQLINEPTHLPRDEISTCIDLIITDNPYSFVDSGVIPSPDPRLKHQVIHGKINFSVPSPPPYKRKIWEYDKANVPRITEELSNLNWIALFENKSVDEMVSIFTDSFLSIMTSNITNKFITINDKDAPWVTPEVKTALRKNSRTYKKWKNKGKTPEGRLIVQQVQTETHSIIEGAKQAYIDDLCAKLCNPKSGPNVFWTAFNRLVNNKKLVNIPPLIEGVSTFVTNFQEKADIFNNYFASICRPIDNGSVLPPMNLNTNNILSSVNITSDAIIKIISKLNANKAHGIDNISIAMLKICPTEVSLPLKIIFDKCIRDGKFPSSWKKANVQPVHKKDSRQSKKNYRPISLLPICGKIFEKIIFDNMYFYLNMNNLLSKNQSGFRPGDSTINQLLSITNDIYESFEHNAETRAVFLDISKAFDKVWHEGLIHNSTLTVLEIMSWIFLQIFSVIVNNE